MTEATILFQAKDRDQLVPDNARSSCSGCHRSFNMWYRRHHCRACGGLFCGDCSSHFSAASLSGTDKIMRYARVCDGCWQTLQQKSQSLQQPKKPFVSKYLSPKISPAIPSSSSNLPVISL